MVYFEMTFAQRRAKELPKNLDILVFEEMHTWLRHKPTMHPPHFRDLFNPSDGNFIPPSRTPKEIHSGDESRGEAFLHTYASFAAYDAVSDSFSESDNIPEEVDASPGVRQNEPGFCSPPPQTASVVHVGSWTIGSPAQQFVQRMPFMDLNDPASASPSPIFRPPGMQGSPSSTRPTPEGTAQSASEPAREHRQPTSRTCPAPRISTPP
jgi:hypothetical protein